MRREELRSLGEAILRAETGAAEITRLCPRCGSSEHGRPLAPGAAHVSLSYAPDLVAVAWSTVGPVGIDVELGGPAGWTELEAAAKASGEGITGVATPGPRPPRRRIEVPDGYVGTVVGLDVSWRLAGPAAQAAPARAARG